VDKQSRLNIKKRFGLAVKQRRQELSISQEELSFRAQLHRTYISDIERGVRNPSLENIAKIAKALETNISAFFANYGIEIEEDND